MGKVGHPFDGLGIQKKRQKLQTLNSFSATLIISNLPCCHYLISNYIVHLVRKILSPFHDSIFGGGLISFIHYNIFSVVKRGLKDWERLFRRKGNWRNFIFKWKVELPPIWILAHPVQHQEKRTSKKSEATGRHKSNAKSKEYKKVIFKVRGEFKKRKQK